MVEDRKKPSVSICRDVEAAISFVNSDGIFEKIFEKHGGMKTVWDKYLNKKELTVNNYKAIMTFAPMMELWKKYEVAKSNTNPNDTLIANEMIDVSVILQIFINKRLHCLH